MLALLSLGATCPYFHEHVSFTLQKERNAIIHHYYANPPGFLSILSWNRAVITGEAALAFVMRDRSLLGPELEVCVSCTFSDDLLQDLEREPLFEHAWDKDEWPRLDYQRTTEFLYKSPSGELIRIICSPTESPFTPFSKYPTSALFNYMDKFSFGCAYRDQTLSRKAVAPDLWRLSLPEQERLLRITHHGGFTQSPYPVVVAEPPVPVAFYNLFAHNDDPDDEELVNTTCLRPMYQCPGQGRFFGDPGSLLDFFEPDLVDHAVMAHLNFPPYGPTAVWRMDGFECDYSCSSGDYLLAEGVSTVCTVGTTLRYGPFTSGLVGRIDVGETQHRYVSPR